MTQVKLHTLFCDLIDDTASPPSLSLLLRLGCTEQVSPQGPCTLGL